LAISSSGTGIGPAVALSMCATLVRIRCKVISETKRGCAVKIDGRCHCGFITYEAEIDPEEVWLCHCTDCQTLSGSAFRTVAPTRKGAFTLLSGEVKTYVKVGESGARRPQGFCQTCGSPIYATAEGPDPKVYGIRLGTVRQRNELTPRRQIWCHSAQPWLGDLGDISRSEMA
jgi:hypothetical protein